jgi:hypothetical protein
MAGFVERTDHLGKLHGIEQFLLNIDIATHNHGLSGYPPEKGAGPADRKNEEPSRFAVRV